jgi:hypothetical protein
MSKLKNSTSEKWKKSSLAYFSLYVPRTMRIRTAVLPEVGKAEPINSTGSPYATPPLIMSSMKERF